jgi:NAD(P)-dependent dehydrogenase (short-subunit alcohol dehydrogenase family)
MKYYLIFFLIYYILLLSVKLWAVINNAGVGDGGALDWTDMSVWRRVMEINFFGVVGVTKAMLPLLKRNPESR